MLVEQKLSELRKESLTPRETGKFVAANADLVTINYTSVNENARKLLPILKEQNFSASIYSSHECHPNPSFNNAAQWVFFIDCLKFSFWTGSEEKFTITYNTLEQRYANKRFIVRMNPEEILNEASIKSENCFGLKRLLESFQENVADLDAQGYNCSDWGPILLHVLVGKLVVERRKQWELQQSRSDLQSLSDLLKFIDI